MEDSARLERQLVARKVRGAERERGLEVGERALARLLRQRIHQVEVEVVEARGGEFRDRGADLAGTVDPPEHRERRRIERLRAERDAVDAGFRVAREAAVLDRPGIRLHRDLGIRPEREPRGEAFDERRDRADAEERGRAAAEEDARDFPARREVEVAVEVGEQRRDIFRLRNVFRARRAN